MLETLTYAGRIVLDSRIVEHIQQFPVSMLEGLATFADSLFAQISRFIGAQVHLGCCRSGMRCRATATCQHLSWFYKLKLCHFAEPDAPSQRLPYLST